MSKQDDNSTSNNETKTITIQDILSNCNQELLIMEKLNSSSSLKTCTYSKGYISQEVYTCLTCYNETKQFAAICLGCSFCCHKEHDLINLYFKRNIRCDCGNSHFVIECKLNKNKEYENYENNYNHNYIGKYCSCDEEDKGLEMIQCFVCEDWFHVEHVNLTFGEETLNQGEFVCRNCFKNKLYSILQGYNKLESVIITNKSAQEISINENDEIVDSRDASNKKKSACKRNTNSNKKDNIFIDNIVSQKKDVMIHVDELEKMLCKCNKCISLYNGKGLKFLENNFYKEWIQRHLFEDEINEDLDECKEENKKIINNINNMNIYQSNAIKSLDVEKQVELSLVSNEFKERLSQYLSEIVNKEGNENVVITYEHIQEFLTKFKDVLNK